jgi:hypothetical protein
MGNAGTGVGTVRPSSAKTSNHTSYVSRSYRPHKSIHLCKSLSQLYHVRHRAVRTLKQRHASHQNQQQRSERCSPLWKHVVSQRRCRKQVCRRKSCRAGMHSVFFLRAFTQNDMRQSINIGIHSSKAKSGRGVPHRGLDKHRTPPICVDIASCVPHGTNSICKPSCGPKRRDTDQEKQRESVSMRFKSHKRHPPHK